MNDFKKKWNDLLNWFRQNGGILNSNLELVNGANGRTFITQDEISNGLIISVPDKLILNHSNTNLVTNSEDFTCNTLICLYLEYIKSNSFWKPYLDCLPQIDEFLNNPIYLYHKKKLPNISNFITNYVDSNYQQYLNYRNVLVEYNRKNLSNHSLDEDLLFRLFLVVKTRMWSNVGMVPILEFFQHSNKSESFLYGHESGKVEITGVSLSKDSEVFINYGTFDDLELFCTYGFLDYSGVNCHHLEFNFKHETSKKKLVDQILSDIVFLYISNEGINLDLVRYLRVNLVDTNRLKNLIDESSSGNIGESLIDLRNEAESLKILKDNLVKTLSTIDLKVVDTKNLSSKELEISKFLEVYTNTLKSSISTVNDYWLTFIN